MSGLFEIVILILKFQNADNDDYVNNDFLTPIVRFRYLPASGAAPKL
jgi:hypothetical protein